MLVDELQALTLSRAALQIFPVPGACSVKHGVHLSSQIRQLHWPSGTKRLGPPETLLLLGGILFLLLTERDFQAALDAQCQKQAGAPRSNT